MRCPEWAERAAMTDPEFWDRVARNLGVNTDPEDDPIDLDPEIRLDPCPVCGSTGACGTDFEGRPMIHTTEDVDA